MSSAGRNLLNANTGPQDTLLFNDANSQFLPQHWGTTANFHLETVKISPSTTSEAPGGKTVFQIQDTSADYLGRKRLEFDINVTAGGGGTFQEFMDFTGLAAIGRIDNKYGSNQIRSIENIELYAYYHRALKDRDDQAAAAVLLNNTDSATRIAQATVAGTVHCIVHIPSLDSDTHKFEPISVLAHEDNWEITWNKLDQIIRTDHAAPAPAVTITNQRLILDLIHVPSDEAAELQYESDSDEGILYLTHEVSDKHQDVSIPAGVTEFSLVLANIRNPLVELMFMLRKSSNVKNAGMLNDIFVSEQISSFSLRGSNLEVYPEQDDIFNRFEKWPTFHSGPAGAFIYSAFFSTSPEDERDHNGSINPFNLSQFTLKIKFAAPTAEVLLLEVLPILRQVTQFKSGDKKRVFV